MNGRIVHEPAAGHVCDVNDYGILLDDNHDYVRAALGAVWECGCGRTFVAQPWRPGEMFPRWRREGRPQ